MSNYKELFNTLDQTVHLFIKEVGKQKLNNMATDEWTVKDVLRHIVFWHEYYAQQYASLASGKKPFIFTSKGGSTRNQKGVDALKSKSKEELAKRLYKAQKSLGRSIVVKKVPGMDYTDKRYYETDEFLVTIIRHIKNHTIQVNKSKDVSRKVS